MKTSSHRSAPPAPACRTPPQTAASLALLLPNDRIARAPLCVWAGDLRGRLVRCVGGVRGSRTFSLDVAGIANNAALVAAHQGSVVMARRLCERQICWQDRFSRRSGDRAVAARGLQPWINLARLEALTGDWRAAMARLERLRRYGAETCIELGHLRVRRTGWQAVTDTPEAFDRWIESVHVLDSLRTLMLNRLFADVVPFVASLDSTLLERMARLADEAVVVARCRLGDFEAARATACEGARSTRGWDRVVFQLRLAEVLASAGDRDGSAAVLLPVATVMEQVSAEKKQELRSLYVLMRLCTACGEVGLEGEALALARDVYAGAVAAHDEVFRIESLRVLAEAAPGEERSRWREELDRLEETTEYARYRRGGPPATPNPVLECLYGELLEFLSN